jgi:hypothetical protein
LSTPEHNTSNPLDENPIETTSNPDNQTSSKMLAKFFTIAPLFALAVKAVTVTSPTEGQNWGTTGAQTVSWEAVSTDPTSFSVVLVNDVSLARSILIHILF